MAPSTAIQARFVENGSITWTPQAATTTPLPDSRGSLLLASPHSSCLRDESDSCISRELSRKTAGPNRLYIQMVNLRTLNNVHGLQTLGENDDDIFLSRLNTVGHTNTPPTGHTKHGDVYELLTSNPKIHPLPSSAFLQIRYAMPKKYYLPFPLAPSTGTRRTLTRR
ncbi:hypothetical protein B0T14DRAFT_507387 [Immersiella caudata]|uniref:Uncharacterized protein n=1 Tax=Immersiella caudata TaxID=314043 RepID=A0AA40CDN4_9PEZI|nr:hypothetical protein B0T14DRAFT_507387 [Immersiella caudata]